ncbi:MAG: YcjX family protein [Paracoccaceae bacterium]
MGLGNLAESLVGGIEDAGLNAMGAVFDPVIRLGVTGLSRAGKTVFITSLVAQLLNRDRMPALAAAANGAIRAAYLEPQPDDTVPRFDYESNLAALTGPEPHWPDSTRAISQLRLSLKVQPTGLLSGLSRQRTVHVDIVDYPGEWLLDLSLMDQSFSAWSQMALDLARTKARAQSARGWHAALAASDPDAPFDEIAAQSLARAFTAYLKAARESGFSRCTPGRFLLPGDLEGSPALTFAPLPALSGRAMRGTLRREMERRYNAYKSKVVKPFFRDHFSRINRQVVLVDALGAIGRGPEAVEDLRIAMAEVLSVFRPGRASWLARLTGRRRADRILFAATKADHLHHSQHGDLTAFLDALLREARDRSDYAGAGTAAMSIAALRTTVEETRNHGGRRLDCVCGISALSGKMAAFYPGKLPPDPAKLLVPARNGATSWPENDLANLRFQPARFDLKPGEGPPHIRLDRAAEFLLGDRLG